MAENSDNKIFYDFYEILDKTNESIVIRSTLTNYTSSNLNDITCIQLINNYPEPLSISDNKNVRFLTTIETIAKSIRKFD